jgi:hypothetical protein
MSYAYRTTDSHHRAAIANNRRDPFHHISAFVRFRPYASVGALHKNDPLAANWLDSLEVNAGAADR